MKLKTPLSIFAVTLTVMAAAQAGSPGAIHGRGQTVNQEGQRAAFVLHAVRTDQNQVRANFAFHTRANDPVRTIEIKLTEPGRCDTTGKTGALTGRAVLTVSQGRRQERFVGQVLVRVADNKQGDRQNSADGAELPSLDFKADAFQSSDRRPDRDRITVEFKSNETDRTFNYNGLVAHGDIIVRSTPN